MTTWNEQDAITGIQDALARGDAAREAAQMKRGIKLGELFLEAKCQMDEHKWPGWVRRTFGICSGSERIYRACCTVPLDGRPGGNSQGGNVI